MEGLNEAFSVSTIRFEMFSKPKHESTLVFIYLYF